ncbi:MAG: tetratricopeptide repeat protein [Candidatus Hydrogenedentes bacterium]|nr:tetratricopeptide repeat protein [Candidatus Hydrogenedentota bacterium]
MIRSVSTMMCVVLAATVMGCATTSQAPLAGKSAAKPAYSLRAMNDNMIVAVSPARQTLQIAGSAGLIIGSSISAISNAKYRKPIHDALEGYDAGKVFDERLAARLEAAYGDALARVEPFKGSAGQRDAKEAEQERLRGLRRMGYDQVLDLQMTYGLFGFEGTLIAKVEGELTSLEQGKSIWKDALVVSSAPVLASDRLSDPTKRMGPNLSSPRLSVDESAMAQWTEDGGKELRARFETAVDGAASALLVQLGLADEAEGNYYLAKLAMNRKKFDVAETYYKKALALDPGHAGARNGLGVNCFHQGDHKTALDWLSKLAVDVPDFGPAQYNAAWVCAVGLKDAAQAKPYYERALALGLPQEKKIDELLAKP